MDPSLRPNTFLNTAGTPVLVLSVRRLAVFWASLLLGVFLSACGTSELFQTPTELVKYDGLPPDSTLEYTIFLVGDAGAPERDTAVANFELIKHALADGGERSAVVFLGDNIYPSGLPPLNSPERADAQRRIDAQLDLVDEYEGRVIFVPGNHDWGGHGLGGNRAARIRQEVYVENVLNRGDTYMPDRGYPGPAVAQVNDDLVIIALDTQWWLEDDKIYGNTGTYQLESEGEFLLELDDVLWRHADKHIVVVAHHPVFTNGEHGGRFRRLRSIFTGEAIARRYLGTPQDLSNLKYRRLREGLLSVFQHHRDLVYAAGHDHSLQYFYHNDQHYVVSGSASKLGFVTSGYGAAFAAERKGFGVLRYHTDGSIWLAFYSPDETGRPELLYRHRLREPNAPLVAFEPTDTEEPLTQADLEESLDTIRTRPPFDSLAVKASPDTLSTQERTEMEEEVDEGKDREVPPPPIGPLPAAVPYSLVSAGTVSVAANPKYRTNSFGELLLGKHYRDAWAMPVEVPIIDLSKTAGGLTVIKKGGGLQTVSLRLLGGDGDQYVLRSIDKDPTSTIPEYLLDTVAEDVVQDQIAAMHPYAAFTLPKMARAAGIYHTHPTLVYVPDDERLGFYRDIFANSLAMFESRPDEDQSDEVRFGKPENVIGTPKLFEEIRKDIDERVDEWAFARARLFDMIIGDWDRHKDQWRWSQFDVTPGKRYRPIPRDRDFAYFKFDGLLPRLVKLGGNERFRRFTNFERHYHDLFGLNFNGAAMDRRFTSDLSEEDWLSIVDSLVTALSDDVIDDAVRDFPEVIYDLHGERIARILKERRDLLPRAATKYYRMLARNVDVVGSDDEERFEVTRINSDSTLVVMYKATDEGEIEREYYRRILKTSETQEVRLYGLAGNDYFKVTGDVRRGIRVRAIGGDGHDTLIDSSTVARRDEYTLFHDYVDGNTWITGSETKEIRSEDPEGIRYEMLRFEFDEYRPLVHFSRNTDDGVLLGGGVKIEMQGFRKEPYAAQHRLYGTAATRRRAFNIHYRGHFLERVGSWDGYVEADAKADRRFRNFYGLGNETDVEDRNFYQAQIGGISVRPSAYYKPLPFTSIQVGPSFEFTRVEPFENAGFPTRLTAEDFQDKYYAGVHAELHINGTDTLAATEHGARWLNSVTANVGVRNTSNAFVRLASDFSYFNTFYNPTRITIGLRAGGATNIGNFEFYQANTLGGQSNLRGFRKTRFAGHTAVYGNLDLRIQLMEFNVYLMRGLAGVLGFFDNGRVWARGDDSNFWDWHQGYGGGIWVAPFNKVAMTATVGFSPDGTLFDISMGFQF